MNTKNKFDPTLMEKGSIEMDKIAEEDYKDYIEKNNQLYNRIKDFCDISLDNKYNIIEINKKNIRSVLKQREEQIKKIETENKKKKESIRSLLSKNWNDYHKYHRIDQETFLKREQEYKKQWSLCDSQMKKQIHNIKNNEFENNNIKKMYRTVYTQEIEINIYKILKSYIDNKNNKKIDLLNEVQKSLNISLNNKNYKFCFSKSDIEYIYRFAFKFAKENNELTQRLNEIDNIYLGKALSIKNQIHRKDSYNRIVERVNTAKGRQQVLKRLGDKVLKNRIDIELYSSHINLGIKLGQNDIKQVKKVLISDIAIAGAREYLQKYKSIEGPKNSKERVQEAILKQIKAINSDNTKRKISGGGIKYWYDKNGKFLVEGVDIMDKVIKKIDFKSWTGKNKENILKLL